MRNLRSRSLASQPDRPRWRRSIGFTLVELLVAMTVTLLLMAVLTRVFASISRSVRDSRGEVQISGALRDLSYRLRTDLRRRTVSDVTPPLEATTGEGYFLYVEGPLTETTFGRFGAEATRRLDSGRTVGIGGDPGGVDAAGVSNDTDGDGTNDFFDADQAGEDIYRRFASMGDVDDYVAFTARAPDDGWFYGKVPRYLVDDTVDANGSGTLDTPGEQFAAMEPTVIRSKFAEVIYWTSPRWATDEGSAGLALAAHPSGMPLYRDGDNNYVPDEIILHQRVLLIRPDLNVRRDFAGFQDTPVLRPALNSETNIVLPEVVPEALHRVYPIGGNSNAPADSGTVTYTSRYPAYVNLLTVGNNADHTQFMDSNWLVGMAGVHHFFDLSLRRVIHPVTGEPTGLVACNSLADLTEPHNRFAHVRYPGRFIGLGTASATTNPGPAGDAATSMPMLATGWNDAVLQWQGEDDSRWETTVSQAALTNDTPPDWFPTGALDWRTRNQTEAFAEQRTGLFQGWLLPHFELGNANPPPGLNTSGTGYEGDDGGWFRHWLPAYDARWDRTSQDVIGGGVRAFDIRGFDPGAPIFATAGPDGRPGVAGRDDNADGQIDTVNWFQPVGSSDDYYLVSELGASASDDRVVRVNDLGMTSLASSAMFPPHVVSNSAPTPPNASDSRNQRGIIGRGDYVDLSYPFLRGGVLSNLWNTYQTGGGAAAGDLRNNYTTFFSGSVLAQFEVRNNFGATAQHRSHGPQPTLDSPMKSSGRLRYTGGLVDYYQPAFDSYTTGYESDGFDQTTTSNGAPAGVPTAALGSPFTQSPAAQGVVWVLRDLPTGGTSFDYTNRVDAGLAFDRFQVDNAAIDGVPAETGAPYNVGLSSVSITLRLRDSTTEVIEEFEIKESLAD